MKKLFLFFVFVCCSVTAVFAQFNVSGRYVAYDNPVGVNYVYVFNGLTGARITYTDTEERTFTWKKYTCTSASEEVLTESEVTSTTFPDDLEDATGYILEIEGGATFRIFVFDYNYNNYMASINSLFVPEKNCSQTTVSASVSFTEMEYCIPNNAMVNKVLRTAILSYKSLKWSDDAEAFQDVSVSSRRNNIASDSEFEFRLSDVYKDTTTFVLYGDQFMREFMKDSTSLKDAAVKPLIKPWAVVTPRTAENERNDRERPAKGTQVEGSAPVDVTLTVYTNFPGGFYRWQIVNILNPNAWIGQSTEPSFIYTFNDYGIYTARVEVTTERLTTDGERCIVKDSVEITIWESELEVPNVFTPNDDGINDKFCVAYKSIVKYDMWIYNRWGRLVFHSSSPDICWDGYIGNTKAPVGAYFYVIDAVGADGKKYKGKKYSGDINLLR